MQILSGLAYAFCSSTLLLMNKAALTYLPYGSLLSIIQFAFSTLLILSLKLLSSLSASSSTSTGVDDFEWSKVKYYLKYILLFVATIYSNMKSLTAVNVETVIIFRSCTPLAVSLIEYLFLHRHLPSFQSFLSLMGVSLGAFWYCLSDSQLQLEGLSAYAWVSVYFLLITTEMTYGKVITSSVKMQSVWGSVYYCSVLSLPLLVLMEYYDGRYEEKIERMKMMTGAGWGIIFLSSILATMIG